MIGEWFRIRFHRPPKSKQELARRARKVIETQGWTQRRLKSKDGRVCLLGAVYAVYNGQHFADLPASAHSLYVSFHQSFCDITGRASLPDWNDYVAKSEDDVINLLTKIEKS